ncbi:MAG: hypothetical protein ACP5KN_12550 [Armatimonadota bacterium]
MIVRRSMLAILVVLVATVAPGAVGCAMDTVAFDQLPQHWARLFPSPSEIGGAHVFPVVTPSPDGDHLPLALPGRAVIEPEDVRVARSDAATGIREASRTYRIREMALWMGSNQEVPLWRASLDLSVKRMASERQARQRYAQVFDPRTDAPVSVGEQGHRRTLAADDYRLTARVGPFILTVCASLEQGPYRETAAQAMPDLTLEIAREVAERIARDGRQTAEGQTAGTAGTALQPRPLSRDSAIKRAVICLGFDERSQLTGVQKTFPAGTEKIALYLQIEGAHPNSEIQSTWYHEDEIIGRHLLIVSGDRKTISYVYARDRTALWPGSYAVELRENDTLVARLTFRVES